MKAIVLAGTSEIGGELIKNLITMGYKKIIATYNSRQPKIKSKEIQWIHYDVKNQRYGELAAEISSECNEWNLFVSCIGSQKPVGRFDKVDMNEWVEGINLNSTYQIASLVSIMKYRSRVKRPCAVFFAGGGTNSATPHYSAQTIGKISLIKTMELMAEEFLDTTFFTIGPGWVKSDIHKATLDGGPDLSGDNYYKTQRMLKSPEKMNTASKTVRDLMTLLKSDKKYVNGRNFSSVHDDLSEENFKRLYDISNDYYKLRRHGNEL